jgi:hypothetical protein
MLIKSGCGLQEIIIHAVFRSLGQDDLCPRSTLKPKDCPSHGIPWNLFSDGKALTHIHRASSVSAPGDLSRNISSPVIDTVLLFIINF